LSAQMEDERKLRVAAWWNAITNVVLAVAKGIVGFFAGSQALIADAVHSAADVAGSLAVVVGLRIARKPPDADHPYGHGRAEVIAASIVAGFLAAAGFEVLISSVKDLLQPPTSPQIIAAFTAFVAVIIKEILYRYNFRLGKQMHSKSLVATAYDHRSDVFSSLAALVGIGLSIVGQRNQILWLMHMDAVAGILVAMLVLKMGFDIARDSWQTLMDRVVVEDADLSPYLEVIEHVPGVRHVDDIRVRDHGQYVIVDVKIRVDAFITVDKGHGVAAEVRYRMKEKFHRVHDVLVHVNPYYGNGGGNCTK
jgi:cation diffusion facilitator family transporter